MRASRVAFGWLIRAEVFDVFAGRLKNINPKIHNVADLMDLKYEETIRGISIDKNQRERAAIF
jgi:ABC-type Fe3+ transport system substrate-binding protein